MKTHREALEQSAWIELKLGRTAESCCSARTHRCSTPSIVAVRRTPDACDGEVVVVRIGTDMTLKCFHRPSDDRVELRPRTKNPDHCTVLIDEQTEDWEIIGVVVGAMIGPRRYSSSTR